MSFGENIKIYKHMHYEWMDVCVYVCVLMHSINTIYTFMYKSCWQVFMPFAGRQKDFLLAEAAAAAAAASAVPL